MTTLMQLEDFTKAHRKFRTYKACPSGIVEKYQTILPAIVVNAWIEFGFQVFSEGFLWTVNPDEYRDIVADFLHDYQVSDVHVIMRTAFGDMVLFYRSKFYHFSAVTMRHGELTGTFELILNMDLAQKDSLNSIFFFHLFRQAKKKLGELSEDELYGFFPAIPLGGEISVENLRRVNLRAHLHVLAELTRPDKENPGK